MNEIPSKALLAAHNAVENRMRCRTYDEHAYNDEVFLEGVADIAYAALDAAAPYLTAAAEARGRKQAADAVAEVIADHARDSWGYCICCNHEWPCNTRRKLERGFAAEQDTGP